MEIEISFKAWSNAEFDIALDNFCGDIATEDQDLIDSIDDYTHCATEIRVDGQTLHVLPV